MIQCLINMISTLTRRMMITDYDRDFKGDSILYGVTIGYIADTLCKDSDGQNIADIVHPPYLHLHPHPHPYTLNAVPSFGVYFGVFSSLSSLLLSSVCRRALHVFNL